MADVSMNELSFAPISELRGLLDRGAVSSRELTSHFLDRLERIGPTYNALAALTRDRALEEADAADRELAAGRTGPLLGIPYGAKDLLAARGAPTIWGSGAYHDQVFDYDAAAIEKLNAAGAPLLGKLALMELAGLHGGIHASVHGPGLEPVGHLALGLRLLVGVRCRSRRRARAIRARLRDGRLDRLAVRVLRHHGVAPDLRPGLALRGDAARSIAGQGRADGPVGHRRRDGPGGDRRLRPARRGFGA